MSDLITRTFKDTLTALELAVQEAKPDVSNIEDCLDLMMKLVSAPLGHWGKSASIELDDTQRIARLEPAMTALKASGAMTLYCLLVDELEPRGSGLELQAAFETLASTDASEEETVRAQWLITDAWDHEGLDLTDEQIDIILDFSGVRTEGFTDLVVELLPEPPNWESFTEETAELVAA